MEPTCKETQEIYDAGEDVYIESRLFEIVPSKEGAGLFGRLKPSPESLEGGR